MKIALAMIVKGTDEEAQLLDRCLYNVEKHVDAMYITSTYKKGDEANKAVEDVCDKHITNYSLYEWENDFSKARNYNFSQVPKKYDYILWCDADDMFRGLSNLRNILENNKDIDTFSMNYLYHFNEFKQPDVVHMKTQIVRNDKCVTWQGILHEDFKENRQLKSYFIKDIERMHLSDEDRISRAKERNVEVALRDVAQNSEDPRSYWNLGNSYIGVQKYDLAKETLEKFVEMSQSEEEKYLTYINLSSLSFQQKNIKKAIEYGQMAIGIKPEYPDAYLSLGQLYFDLRKFKDAEKSILLGLVKKPPYYSIIVFNPRTYDFEPLMLLAKVYWQLARPDQAVTCLKGCLKIQPDNVQAQKMLALLKEDKKVFDEALVWVAKLKDIKDRRNLKRILDQVPKHLQDYPAICIIRNTHFIKETSTGKDIVYYCGMTEFEWNPEMAKTKGIGGSEESVINLTQEWAKMGYNVTVYANCGTESKEYNGVKWEPFWRFNVRDKQDVVILWRTPIPLDHDINAPKIFVDLHDVIPEGEFTEKRLAKITKIMVKTKFHRSLFPNVPDEKFAIIPNGIDFNLFNQNIKRDPYLLINTSSPDRSMDVLPELFKRVKEKVPQAKLKWAYGFDIFDIMFSGDPEKQKWKNDTLKAMEDAGIENLGRLSQAECAKLYMEANILAYPTEFAEIDCISVKKAQLVGCLPVTTDFGALEESIYYRNLKIPSRKRIDTWSRPYKFTYGIEGEDIKQQWVDTVVNILQGKAEDYTLMKKWAQKFDYKLIAKQWIQNL